MNQINKQKSLIEVGGSYSYTSNKEQHSFCFTVVSISDNKKVSIVIDDYEPFIFSVGYDEIQKSINNKSVRGVCGV